MKAVKTFFLLKRELFLLLRHRWTLVLMVVVLLFSIYGLYATNRIVSSPIIKFLEFQISSIKEMDSELATQNIIIRTSFPENFKNQFYTLHPSLGVNLLLLIVSRVAPLLFTFLGISYLGSEFDLKTIYIRAANDGFRQLILSKVFCVLLVILTITVILSCLGYISSSFLWQEFTRNLKELDGEFKAIKTMIPGFPQLPQILKTSLIRQIYFFAISGFFCGLLGISVFLACRSSTIGAIVVIVYTSLESFLGGIMPAIREWLIGPVYYSMIAAEFKKLEGSSIVISVSDSNTLLPPHLILWLYIFLLLGLVCFLSRKQENL